MKTIIIKSELEQLEEQYPELYKQVYNLGYEDGMSASLYASLYSDDYSGQEEHPYVATSADNSTRFLSVGMCASIYDTAQKLEQEGYKAGNSDWREFLASYGDWKYEMYIAWNPTHKLFAVESNKCILDEIYPHLVDATEDGYTPPTPLHPMNDDLPF